MIWPPELQADTFPLYETASGGHFTQIGKITN